MAVQLGLFNAVEPLAIAHVCRTGWPHVGGMESVVDGLAAALAARGHDVSVVTLDRALSDGRALPAGTHQGVRYERLRRLGPRRYPFALGLRDAVRGAQVVHVHGIDGLADQAVRLRGDARVGISTHGGFLHTDRHRRLKAVWLRTITRRTLRRADAVWFTSRADARSFAPVPGTVMTDGVDTRRFAAIRRRPVSGRWLVVGRIDLHKGHDDLIDALHALRRLDDRPFQVDVVGPERVPGLIDALRSRSGDLPVVFHGEADPGAVDALLSRAELALFPSRYEGFGVAVVEAMAAGVPVVASAIPAFDELIRPGIDGFRADFRDAGRAARRLLELRDGALERVGRTARIAAGAWSWDRKVLEWEAAYRALLGR